MQEIDALTTKITELENKVKDLEKELARFRQVPQPMYTKG